MGFICLPTHSRDAHIKFFLTITSNFRIKILSIRALLCAIGSKGLNVHCPNHFMPRYGRRRPEF